MKNFIYKNAWIIVAVVAMISLCFLRSKVEDEVYLDMGDFQVEDEEKVDYGNGTVLIHGGGIDREDGRYVLTEPIRLPKGRHSIEVDHQCSEDSYFTLMDGGYELASYPLKADELRTTVEYSASKEYGNFCFAFYYGGDKDIELKHVELECLNGLFYWDNVFLCVLAILALLLSVWLYRRNKWRPEWLILIFMVLSVSVPLFLEKLPSGTDLTFHLMRIEGIKDALLDGQFPAVIYPDDLNHHGYMGSIYPNLFLYIPALLRLLGISTIGVWRFTLIIVSVFTFLSMYYAVCVILGGKNAALGNSGNVLADTVNKRGDLGSALALLAASLYCIAPYRVSDLYFRATLGESIALIFYPLVMAGLYSILAGDKEKWPLLVLGMSGLIEAHVLSSLFGAGICVFVCACMIKELLQKDALIAMVKAVLWSVCLNLGFLIPFFYYRTQNLQLDETIRWSLPEQNVMSLGNIFSTYPRQDSDPWAAAEKPELRPGLGVVGLCCIVLALTLIVLRKEKSLRHKYLKSLFALTVVCIISSTELFPYETLSKVDIIYRQLMLIQHPWRLLSAALPALCILSAAALMNEGLHAVGQEDTAKSPLNRVDKGGGSILGVALLALAFLCLVPEIDIFIKKETNDSALTMVTGGLNDDANVDYVPHNFTEVVDMEADSAPLATEGIELKDFVKNGTHITLSYEKSFDGDGWIRLPLLYYYGYRAVDGNGKPFPIAESEIGTLKVLLPEEKGGGTVSVSFSQPWFNYAGGLIGILSALLLIWKKVLKKNSGIERIDKMCDMIM